MTDAEILRIAVDAMNIGVRIGAPILLTALVIGVVVSLFQAITQVQEMTLTFVPKLVGVALVLLFAGSWMMREMVAWVVGLWESMGGML